jgi:hypothetical protein
MTVTGFLLVIITVVGTGVVTGAQPTWLWVVIANVTPLLVDVA